MHVAGSLEDDLGDLLPLVKDELCRGWYASAVLARARQLQIKQANDRIEQAHHDGVGQKVMAVDSDAYFYWQVREPGCWQDKGFRKKFMRDNPETRVKYTPRTTTIVKV